MTFLPKPQAPATLLSLPDDVLTAIFLAVGASPDSAGTVEGLSPALAPALALAAAHPSLSAVLRSSLTNLSLTFSFGSDVTQAAQVLSLTGHRLHALTLTGPYPIPQPALRSLLALRPGLRKLTVSHVTGIPDIAWQTLFKTQSQSLTDLSLAHVPGIGEKAALALADVQNLRALTMEAVPAVQPLHLIALLRVRGGTLHRLALRMHFPTAHVVAAHCNQLETLALGAETDPRPVVSACVANARSLRVADFIGRPVLREPHVRSIVSRCVNLSDFFAPTLSPSVLANVVRSRLRRLEIRLGSVTPAEISALAQHCTRVSQLLLEAPVGRAAAQEEDRVLVESFVRLVRALGPGLESLCIVNVAAVDDEMLARIGSASGKLRDVAVDGLEEMSTDGIEALVKTNGASLRRVAIGAKCKRLSNVSIMRVLGKWCPRLTCVSFPRWHLVTRKPREACLDSAVEKFRRCVPNATIVVG